MSDLADKLAALKSTAVSQLNECGVSNIDHDQLDGYVNSLRQIHTIITVEPYGRLHVLIHRVYRFGLGYPLKLIHL